MVLWPCGHTEPLDLSWLPDAPARRRKAREVAGVGHCMKCWITDVGGAADAAGERDGAVTAAVIPFPLEGERRGQPAATQSELDELIEAGTPWIEVVSTVLDLVVAWVPDSCRVDIGPGAKAIVAGAGPVVRSRGRVRVTHGGRVAGGPGSRTVLAGGRAAVGQGGALVAEEGLGLVDAGARVAVAQEARAHDVGVYALPGSIVAAAGRAKVIDACPWGVLVTADGVIGQADGDPDVELTEMLELARSMGSAPGL